MKYWRHDMKVKDLKEQLNEYSDDTELIVLYWDARFWSDLLDIPITPETWSAVVDTYEGGEWEFQSDASETIESIIIEKVKSQEA
jgi:hypothetical protein